MNQTAFHPYYLDVVQAWKSELQNFLSSEENDLEALLENELVKELSMSRLKELLDNTLSQQGVIFDNNLYSVQPNIHVPREYHIGLEMDGRNIYNAIVPLNENSTFDDAQSVKMFFEKIARALYVAIHEPTVNEGLGLLTVPGNLLNPLKEEMDSVEKINRLNFKHFLGTQNDEVNYASPAAISAVLPTEEPSAQKETATIESFSQLIPETSVEVLSNSIDLDVMENSIENSIGISGDYDFEDDDFYDDTAMISVENSELQVSSEIKGLSEFLPELGDESDDILPPDFDIVQVPTEVEAFNFAGINGDLNTVFKAVSSADREALKEVKATIWELELKQEEEPLEESDFKYLLQNVLSVESDERVVLKWQLNLIRTLLER